MTVIDDLRDWFHGEVRPSKAPLRLGDAVETRAILELADRLDKLEARRHSPAIKSSRLLAGIARQLHASDSSLKPIRITGPGRYRMRDGNVAVVMRRNNNPPFPWSGETRAFRKTQTWADNGTLDIPGQLHPYDIVAGPLEANAQKTPEEGWMNVHRNHTLGSSLQGGVIYLTRKEADSAPSAKHRVDCIKVSYKDQPSVHWRTVHNPWDTMTPDDNNDDLPF